MMNLPLTPFELTPLLPIVLSSFVRYPISEYSASLKKKVLSRRARFAIKITPKSNLVL